MDKETVCLVISRFYNTVGKIDTTALKYLDNEVLIDHIKWLMEFNSNRGK